MNPDDPNTQVTPGPSRDQTVLAELRDRRWQLRSQMSHLEEKLNVVETLIRAFSD